MYGVALEGGGAKGAYHIGAMKAILECEFNIGAVVGTSIGAFNAAVIAQGDFDRLYEAWWSSNTSLGIDINELEFNKVLNKKIDFKSLKYWASYITHGISSKGIDISKLRKLYETYLDEEKLRKSTIDYGLVTVSLSDRKPVYIYKEDIVEGMLLDYVLASSYLPVFKQEKLLEDKFFIDGGVYDNCPISLLTKKGYKDIIEIRTGAIGIKRRVDRKRLNIIKVSPSKDTGSIMFGDNKSLRNNIQMGYYDTLRVIKKYIGKKYYVIPTEDSIVFNMLVNLTDEKIKKILGNVKLIGLVENMEWKKILFEKILPNISNRLKKEERTNYQKTIVAMIESIADEDIMKIYKLYSFEEFILEFKKKIPKLLKKEKDSLIKNRTNELILRLVKEIEF